VVAAAIDDGKRHLMMVVSGSVATIQLPAMISLLAQQQPNLSIHVVLTRSAVRFLAGRQSPGQQAPTVASLAAFPNVVSVHQDDKWVARGDGVLHIWLRW
jgi:hypothetical protein